MCESKTAGCFLAQVVREQACSTCVSFRFFAEQQSERETERLWENWLIAKTAFPSPRCDMSCGRPVGAARSRCTQGEEGGLKLTKRSLFTFRAMSRLWGEILLFGFRSFQCRGVWALRARAEFRQVSKWLLCFWFLIRVWCWILLVDTFQPVCDIRFCRVDMLSWTYCSWWNSQIPAVNRANSRYAYFALREAGDKTSNPN